MTQRLSVTMKCWKLCDHEVLEVPMKRRTHHRDGGVTGLYSSLDGDHSSLHAPRILLALGKIAAAAEGGAV